MDRNTIRSMCNAKFAELLEFRNVSTDATRNKTFRRDVMHYLIEACEITIAAAATHYNHTLIEFKKHNPQQVVGLGRPEDKKGGRKKKIVAAIEVVVKEINGEQEEAFAYSTVEPAQFVVKKKKDNTVVAEGLSFTDALALCEAARAKKKAALIWE